MSSEISTERARQLPSNSFTAGKAVATDDGFRPWHFFVLASILLATVAVILARQSSPGHLILLSLTIAAAGAAAGAFYRMLAPLVGPVVPATGEPINDRTRAALQREKVLVLRSIKELEFDRAMGKLSQKDFDEMAGRLRSRALSLMKQLDAGRAGYAEAIETELGARLAASLATSAERAASTASSTKGAASTAPPITVRLVDRVIPACASCGAANDQDAVFCKKCGTRLPA